MHQMEVTLAQLLNMFNLVEKTMKKNKFDTLLISFMTKTNWSRKIKGKNEAKKAKSKRLQSLSTGSRKPSIRVNVTIVEKKVIGKEITRSTWIP